MWELPLAVISPYSFHILGKAGPSMQQDFYSVEHLAAQLLSSAFVNLNNIPDYRLRPMLHILSKVPREPRGPQERRRERLSDAEEAELGGVG